MTGGAPPWSLIVPTLNEASVLPDLLASLKDLRGSAEIIIADGGSEDATRRLAREAGARVTEAQRGRARQMNAGAGLARGDRLLFVHADMVLPAGALQAAEAVLARSGVVAGCFEARFASANPVLWGGRWKTYLWVHLLGFAPGDHGLFLDRERFEEIGGFPNVPILEERHICRRLRREGSLGVAHLPVRASARRFHDHGMLRTYLRMARVLLLDSLGAPPERLLEIYHGISR